MIHLADQFLRRFEVHFVRSFVQSHKVNGGPTTLLLALSLRRAHQEPIHSRFGEVRLVVHCCTADVDNSKAQYMGRIEDILKKMPKWREERLPPPRVSQSEVNATFMITGRLLDLSGYIVR